MYEQSLPKVVGKSVCTMFLSMYKKSLSKLAGGVIITGLHSQQDVEVEPCRKRVLISVLKKVKVNNKLGRQYCSESTKRNWKVCGQEREQHQNSER